MSKPGATFTGSEVFAFPHGRENSKPKMYDSSNEMMGSGLVGLLEQKKRIFLLI